MVFLKAFSFIVFNFLLGFLFVNFIKALLFYPRKKIYLNGKHLPLTPGFLYRKHDQLFSRIKGAYHDFTTDSQEDAQDSMVSRLENKAFRAAWNKLEMIDDWVLLPANFREKIRYFLALVYYEIVKQFFRSFIPYLMEKYRTDRYLVILEEKLDMQVIEGYYNRYFHRYLLIFFAVLCSLIGIINMIWFFVIN